MTKINFSGDCDATQTSGHLLAGFVRAVDAEMAILALADRGYEMDAVRAFSDHQMLMEFGGASAVLPSASQSDRRPADDVLDCHWLLVRLEVDDAMVGEYLRACDAELMACRTGGENTILQARTELVQRLRDRRQLGVDNSDPVAAPEPDFHPISWQSWTHGSAGAGND